jgi:hypothetical protein
MNRVLLGILLVFILVTQAFAQENRKNFVFKGSATLGTMTCQLMHGDIYSYIFTDFKQENITKEKAEKCIKLLPTINPIMYTLSREDTIFCDKRTTLYIVGVQNSIPPDFDYKVQKCFRKDESGVISMIQQSPDKSWDFFIYL